MWQISAQKKFLLEVLKAHQFFGAYYALHFVPINWVTCHFHINSLLPFHELV
jgi:hypothetical protein